MAQKTVNMFGEEYVEDICCDFSPGKVNRESALMEKVKGLFPDNDVSSLCCRMQTSSGYIITKCM